MFRLILIAAGSCCLASCSIYPLPEDVTRFRSEDLSRITRCYTRDALRDEIRRVLTKWNDKIIYDKKTGQETQKWLDEDEKNYNTLSLKLFEPGPRSLYGDVMNLQISYDFTIDGTEMNTSGIDFSLLKKFTSSSSNLLELKLQNDRTRQVKRQFRNYDSFDSLIRGITPDYCRGLPDREDPIYPTAGFYRINTLIRDFIDQNQHNNLGAKDNAEVGSENDTIMFMTKNTGNFDPVLSRASVPGSYFPSSFKVNSDHYRQDIHTIIVLVQLPVKGEKIVVFDASGNISGTQKLGSKTNVAVASANAKFAEIRENNFRDNVAIISTTLNNNALRLNP